jgi:hypothetical protein
VHKTTKVPEKQALCEMLVYGRLAGNKEKTRKMASRASHCAGLVSQENQSVLLFLMGDQ